MDVPFFVIFSKILIADKMYCVLFVWSLTKIVTTYVRCVNAVLSAWMEIWCMNESGLCLWCVVHIQVLDNHSEWVFDIQRSLVSEYLLKKWIEYWTEWVSRIFGLLTRVHFIISNNSRFFFSYWFCYLWNKWDKMQFIPNIQRMLGNPKYYWEEWHICNDNTKRY